MQTIDVEAVIVNEPIATWEDQIDYSESPKSPRTQADLDWMRCTICGELNCQCNKPVYKEYKMSEIVPLKDLAGYAAKQHVSGIEGVITKCYEAKDGIKGNFKWHLQGAIMVDSDQTEHRINFNDKLVAQIPASVEGKRWRITPAPGKPETLSYKAKSDKYEAEVVIGAGCKIVQIGGVNPIGSGSSNSQSTEDKPKYHLTPVKERVKLLLDIHQAVQADADNRKLVLTVTQVEAYTLFIAGSYRADKGAYAPPEFKEHIPSWKEFFHKKNNKTLEEMSEESLKEIAIWAMKDPSETANEYVNGMKKAGLACAKEKEWTPESIVKKHIEEHVVGYEESLLKFWLDKNGIPNPNETDWIAILKMLPKMTEEIQQSAGKDEPSQEGDDGVPG